MVWGGQLPHDGCGINNLWLTQSPHHITSHACIPGAAMFVAHTPYLCQRKAPHARWVLRRGWQLDRPTLPPQRIHACMRACAALRAEAPL